SRYKSGARLELLGVPPSRDPSSNPRRSCPVEQGESMRKESFARRRAVGLLAGAAVAGAASDRACAQSEAWRVHGVSDMQQIGRSIAFLGDVNGDGVPDYVAGGPATGFSNPGNGHAVVVSGADGSVLFEFVGATGAGFGTAVESAGDVDGDGVDDV